MVIENGGKFGRRMFCAVPAKFLQGASVAGSRLKSADDFMFRADCSHANTSPDGHATSLALRTFFKNP